MFEKKRLMEKVQGVMMMTFARNVIISGVDNTSSSHTHNRKDKFLALDERPTDAINNSTGAV